jgi:hypothetical protein
MNDEVTDGQYRKMHSQKELSLHFTSSPRNTADENYLYRSKCCCRCEYLRLSRICAGHGDTEECRKRNDCVNATPCALHSVEYDYSDDWQERGKNGHGELVESSEIPVIVNKDTGFHI